MLTTKSTELTTKPNPSKKIIEQLPESSKQLIKPKTCHIILTFMLSSKNSYDICIKIPYGIEVLNMFDVLALCQNSIRYKNICLQCDMVDLYVNGVLLDTVLGERPVWGTYTIRDTIIKVSECKIIPKEKDVHVFKLSLVPKISKEGDILKISVCPKQRDVNLECIGVRNKCDECWFCKNGYMCKNFLFCVEKNFGDFFVDFGFKESKRLKEWKKTKGFSEPIYIKIR